MSAEIKDLKNRLARPVFVNYRDWNADRATMLELLSKSKFRSMSFVDEIGIRAHNYTVNKFLAARYIAADLALLSLTGDQSSDSVLIRSSATGGASMLSVRGGDTPRFNLMTLTSTQAAGKIHSRLLEAAPCFGATIVLPVNPASALSVPADQIARIIRKVYATENPEHRVTITMTPAWESFLSLGPEDVAPSGAALLTMRKSITSVRTLVRAVTRAVITRKFFLEETSIPEPVEDRTLPLNDEDLVVAQQWFRDVCQIAFKLKHIDTRRNNSAIARAAWVSGPSVESGVAAKMALVKLIQADEHGMVSANAAAKSPGITARTLDAVIEAYPSIFHVETDARRPGAKRAAERMISLAKGWDSEAAPVGGSDTLEPGSEIDDTTLDALYREWQVEAQANMRNEGRPAIVVADLPPALMRAVIGVQRRHWQTTTLIPSGPPASPDGSGQPGLELWFRIAPDGSDMCAWDKSFSKWKLHEKWQGKDEAAREERDHGAPSESDTSKEEFGGAQ